MSDSPSHGSEQSIVNIVGQKVALGPMRRDLIPTYCRWRNDLSTSRTLGLSWPRTLQQEEVSFESLQSASERIDFTVYENSSLRPIGTTSLLGVDHRHSRADFGIIIGEANARGKGYGTEATSLTLDYAFNAVGLENVMLTVYEFNVAGIAAYHRAGFKDIGRRRRCSRLGRSLWDLIYMECVADEFESPVLAKAFLADGR
ncbi:MAG: GNAT family protein [Nitrolancea sp.]